MAKYVRVVIGEEFHPAPQFRTLFYIYLLSLVFLIFLLADLPVLVFAPIFVGTILSAVLLCVLIFVLAWIPKYYTSMLYKLTDHDMTWRRGVWFRKTGIIPYNRITNIDIEQGPISRRLGIASLKIETAGYGGQKTTAEIRIEGVTHFEELRSTTMGYIQGTKPVGVVGTYEKEDRLLHELVKIRKLLEKSPRK
jgi:membrane protein YdbS with pleckstrin-like domain